MSLEFAKEGFGKCISDARNLVNISLNFQSDNQKTALRGSLMLVVSAFDFFIHEIIRVETKRRISENPGSVKFEVPFNITACGQDVLSIEVDLLIRKRNSIRSFVGSSKVKECFSTVSIDIWSELENHKEINVKEVRKRLDVIWAWRNRIAHEGDLVPSNSSFVYWEIYSSDVIDSADFLSGLAHDIVDVVEILAH
ncbi:MAG: hypothetical protein GVY34_11640 [Alphaproteobacteria bacterium]|jgi:hypothetical protein|nr:hypothetical protein [Alphaproteobacteria bacterium]